MASLSELPERERRFALRLAYWSWFALFLGAIGIILWLRHVLPVAFVLVILFVAQEIWQQIYIRQVLRRQKNA